MIIIKNRLEDWGKLYSQDEIEGYSTREIYLYFINWHNRDLSDVPIYYSMKNKLYGLINNLQEIRMRKRALLLS